MRFLQNNKSLWHIQCMGICSDGTAYDMFLLADHEPTAEELRTQFIDDYGSEELAEEVARNAAVYEVYFEEIYKCIKLLLSTETERRNIFTRGTTLLKPCASKRNY